MPRNSSGNYTLPSGNPVVSGTLIETAWANPTMSDIGTAITDSLDRNGRGAMLAALKLIAGTVAAPALSFSAESTSGFYRDSANVIAMSVAGVQRQSWTATGTTITGTLGITGAVTFTGSLGVTGNLSVDGDTVLGSAGADSVVINASTVSYPNGATVSGALVWTGNQNFNGSNVLGNAPADGLSINSSAITWINAPTHSNNHIFSGNVSVSGTLGGGASTLASLTVSGITALNGGTTIGDAAGDALTIVSTTITTPTNYGFTGTNTGFFNTSPQSFAGASQTYGLVIGDGTGSPGATYYGASSGGGSVNFADSTSGGGRFAGTLEYDHSNDSMHIRTSALRRLSIDSTGNTAPSSNNAYSSGTGALRWSNVFSVLGNFSSNLSASGNLQVDGSTTLGDAAGDTLTIASSAVTWSNNPTHSGNHTHSGSMTLSGTGTQLSQATSNNGGNNQWTLSNTSNTASSQAVHLLQVAGATAGDAFTRWSVNGVTEWSAGVDNSASDAFVIAASNALGTTNVLSLATAGGVTLPLGDLSVSRAQAGGDVFAVIQNTSNTASARAYQQIIVAGGTAGDPVTQYVVTGGTTWTVGIDNDDVDTFTIQPTGSLSAAAGFQLSASLSNLSWYGTSAATPIAAFFNSNAAPFGGVRIGYTAAAPNSTAALFLVCADNAATRFELRSNGGLANFSANNVNLSDARVKTDIAPAPSYWDKVKSLDVTEFHYIDQTDSKTHIGVIAQQVDSVVPELVDHSGFGTDREGAPLLAVYQTDMQYMALKALQEAMGRIERLESQRVH
jgi:hypothetical protein